MSDLAFPEIWARLAHVNLPFLGVVDVQRVMLAVLVLGVAILARKPFARAVLDVTHRGLRRLGSARMVNDTIGPPARALLPLLALIVVNEAILQNHELRLIGRDLARTMVLVLLFWALYRAVAPLMARLESHSAMVNGSMTQVCVAGLHLGVTVLGVAAVLEVWGIHIGPVLAGFGLVGAAVALGAQNLFKNLIGGMFIIIEDRFQNGDWIQVQDICEGTVEQIGLRTTKVRQFDLSPVYVPNSALSDNALINYSRMTYRRINWEVGISYGASLEQLTDFTDRLRSYITGSPDFVQTDDAPVFVRLDNLGASSVNIMVYCFTKTTNWAEWLEVKERLAAKIVEISRAIGTGLAYPSQSLYIETVPPGFTPPPAAKG